MRPPASASSSSLFRGLEVKELLEALNPRNWQRNAPTLWNASYLVAARQETGREPPLTSRALPPDDAKADDKQWQEAVFYEDVHVLGFEYRNALQSSFIRHPEKASDDDLQSFEFQYREIDCLNHQSEALGIGDGGIDVDNGYARCTKVNEGVHVVFSKTVRFTEPAFAEDELDALSQALLPLILDSWLHLVMFNLPTKTGKGGHGRRQKAKRRSKPR